MRIVITVISVRWACNAQNDFTDGDFPYLLTHVCTQFRWMQRSTDSSGKWFTAMRQPKYNGKTNWNVDKNSCLFHNNDMLQVLVYWIFVRTLVTAFPRSILRCVPFFTNWREALKFYTVKITQDRNFKWNALITITTYDTTSVQKYLPKIDHLILETTIRVFHCSNFHIRI